MKQQRVRYDNDSINWFFNGIVHRDVDLPAIYYFYNAPSVQHTGRLGCARQKKIFDVYYYQHGHHHRTTGPAVIDYVAKNKYYYYQSTEYDSLEEIQMLEACR